jgi:hypothetical protein
MFRSCTVTLVGVLFFLPGCDASPPSKQGAGNAPPTAATEAASAPASTPAAGFPTLTKEAIAALDALGICKHNCKYRAVCEMGQPGTGTDPDISACNQRCDLTVAKIPETAWRAISECFVSTDCAQLKECAFTARQRARDRLKKSQSQ